MKKQYHIGQTVYIKPLKCWGKIIKTRIQAGIAEYYLIIHSGTAGYYAASELKQLFA